MTAVSPVARSAAVSAPDKPVVTTTSWNLDARLDLRDWLRYGRRLGLLGRSVNWWIGDWLRYGNAAYGERYSRASRVTGYDAQSLMNMVYVASRFEPERRREGLSWSHHAELAALSPAEQEHWLTLAEAQRLSVHSLRLELRAARKAVCDGAGAVGAIDETVRHGDAERIVCPNCRHVIGTAL